MFEEYNTHYYNIVYHKEEIMEQEYIGCKELKTTHYVCPFKLTPGVKSPCPFTDKHLKSGCNSRGAIKIPGTDFVLCTNQDAHAAFKKACKKIHSHKVEYDVCDHHNDKQFKKCDGRQPRHEKVGTASDAGGCKHHDFFTGFCKKKKPGDYT